MATICDLARLLANPLKREMVLRVYAARDGFNVGLLADEMHQKGLGMAGVSQYLRQLEQIGIVRRYRAGRYVNYVGDARAANPAVRKALELVLGRMRRGKGGFERVFGVLRNPFRAAVVSALSKGRRLSAATICDRTGHNIKVLKRDLQEALDAGLIETDGETYCFVKPGDDAVAQLIAML